VYREDLATFSQTLQDVNTELRTLMREPHGRGVKRAMATSMDASGISASAKLLRIN
jgi:hypothetical protein